jgi:hypothetical protein
MSKRRQILMAIQPYRPVDHSNIHNLPDRSVFTLLSSLTSSKCTDPRDMIYGLLGICNDDHGIGVEELTTAVQFMMFISIGRGYRLTGRNDWIFSVLAKIQRELDFLPGSQI